MDIKIKFTPSDGFRMNLAVPDPETYLLPNDFVSARIKNKLLDFTSLRLMKLNRRVADSLNEVFIMSEDIIEEVIDAIRQHLNQLYRASESVASLDMLLGFVCYRNKVQISLLVLL